jgi:predicted S18 family serine protease
MQNKISNRQLLLPLFFMGALAILLTVGCATSGSRSAATMKISESEKAISVARESNAIANTPVDLRNAENKLAQANQAFTDDEYLEAARLAEKATVDADCARILANAEKAKKDVDQMHQNIRNLHQDPE